MTYLLAYEYVIVYVCIIKELGMRLDVIAVAAAGLVFYKYSMKVAFLPNYYFGNGRAGKCFAIFQAS